MEETVRSAPAIRQKVNGEIEGGSSISPISLISALCVNRDRFIARLISLNVYHVENILDELGFRCLACETPNFLSIFEYDVNRLMSNPKLSGCFGIIFPVQLSNSECVLVL